MFSLRHAGRHSDSFSLVVHVRVFVHDQEPSLPTNSLDPGNDFWVLLFLNIDAIDLNYSVINPQTPGARWRVVVHETDELTWLAFFGMEVEPIALKVTGRNLLKSRYLFKDIKAWYELVAGAPA